MVTAITVLLILSLIVLFIEYINSLKLMISASHEENEQVFGKSYKSIDEIQSDFTFLKSLIVGSEISSHSSRHLVELLQYLRKLLLGLNLLGVILFLVVFMSS